MRFFIIKDEDGIVYYLGIRANKRKSPLRYFLTLDIKNRIGYIVLMFDKVGASFYDTEEEVKIIINDIKSMNSVKYETFRPI